MSKTIYDAAKLFGDAYVSAGSSLKDIKAVCPCHDDNKPSLCVSIGDNGGIIIHCPVCKAGAEQVIASGKYNFTMADLAPPSINGHASQPKGDGWTSWCVEHWGQFVASYDYTDEQGKLIKQIVRTDRKQFPQRRRDENGKWKYKCAGLRVVVYRLHILAKADPSRTVFLVEGEKDVQTLEAWGLIATCNDGGAEKFTKAHAEQIRGRHVVIVGDNDDAGRRHVALCQKLLQGVAASVRVLWLPYLPEKGDVTDWRDKCGGTKELFEDLLGSLGDDEGNEPGPATTVDNSPPPEASQVKICLAESIKRIDAGEPEKKIIIGTIDALKKIQAEEIEPPPSFRQLATNNPTLRREVIRGLLRDGEIMNIIAPPKYGKSWLAIDLALTVVGGGHWLGKYWTEAGNVLIIDNELHAETSAARIPKVGEAKGVSFDSYADRLYVQNLRGCLVDIDGMAKIFGQFRPGDFSLVIIDALYRSLPKGTDENDNGAMAAVFNTIDSYALAMQAAFVLIHHASKGNQAGKAVTDVGAGAGAQSRATDTHLILRQHEEPGVVVLDGAVRSFAPVDPICLRWDFPAWSLAEGLDPGRLKAAKPAAAARKPEAEHGPSKFQAACNESWEVLCRIGPATKSRWKEEAGKGGSRINAIAEALTEQGLIEVCEVQTPKGSFEGYRALEGKSDNPDNPDCPTCPTPDGQSAP